MSETFRVADAGEIPELARLVGHSFVGRSQERLEEALAKGPYGRAETLWVGEEDDLPTSVCHLLRLVQWVGGVQIPTMGLAMVAVSPTHRRRGVARRLVASGLRHARERGDLASALYPFRISFYEGLGYGLAGEAHQYRLPPEALPDAPERVGVRLAESAADRRALRDVYDRWVQGENGQLDRDDGEWSKVLEEEGRAAALYRGESGEPEGYAIIRYRVDLPPAERFLEVEERAWLTPAARRGIYAWLGSLGDQWRQIAYRAHPDEGFGDAVREPRLPPGSAPGWGLWFPSATLLAGPMFRLLDVPAAWAARRVAEDAALTISLEVSDEQIPENNGAWRLRLEQGRVEVVRSATQPADATLRTPVRSLSRIYIGALTPSAAVEAGAAEIDRADVLPRLDAALRLRRPWTFDRF
ncbi:MAG: GNAT family N-acetyltransferase [Gemmatimonadetes bacterium]|nr:GNAT family N-acetyltransferase [Gemmatimonadota bacterium]